MNGVAIERHRIDLRLLGKRTDRGADGARARGIVIRPHGLAEVEAAVFLSQGLPTATGSTTVGANNGYETGLFVKGARALRLTPHVAAMAKGGTFDGRITRHAGYAMSQRKQKSIEELLGGLKTAAGLLKLKQRGTAPADWLLTFVREAFSAVRFRRLAAAGSQSVRTCTHLSRSLTSRRTDHVGVQRNPCIFPTLLYLSIRTAVCHASCVAFGIT